MVVLRLKNVFLLTCLMASFGAMASINPSALTVKNSQMVNLNLEIRSKNKTVQSDLMMPFYQTAELEKKIGGKNVLIELNPKRGKNPDEISIEMKFYKAAGVRAFFKKEFIAKVNQESRLNFKGMSVRVKPLLN